MTADRGRNGGCRSPPAESAAPALRCPDRPPGRRHPGASRTAAVSGAGGCPARGPSRRSWRASPRAAPGRRPRPAVAPGPARTVSPPGCRVLAPTAPAGRLVGAAGAVARPRVLEACVRPVLADLQQPLVTVVTAPVRRVVDVAVSAVARLLREHAERHRPVHGVVPVVAD